MKKVLIHTMDHNKHYDYFRRLAFKELGKVCDLVYFIHKNEDKRPSSFMLRLKHRISIERRLLKLSLRNKDVFVYLKNRLLSGFFNKHKKAYDREKLQYIDKHFSDLASNLPAPDHNVFYIDDINNQKELIETISPDLLVLVGAPFVKREITNLNIQKINLHMGFLPNYKGIKTIEWAVLNKDFEKIGYTVHELTDKLDGGPILFSRKIPVSPLNIDLKSIYVNLYEQAFNDLLDLLKRKEFPRTRRNRDDYRTYYNYQFNPANYKKLMRGNLKMAIFAGNPVQYHAPIYRSLSNEKDVELTVMFGSEIGGKRFYSKEFNAFIEWDVPVLEGYKYKIYKNFALEGSKGFFSRVNFGMFVDVIKNRFDVVLIHGYDTASSWLVFLAAKISRTGIIWRGEAMIRSKSHQGSIRKIVKTKVLPAYFRRCDAVLYSCSGNREFLRQFDINPKKMFPIPCAVDNGFFRRERLGAEARVQLREELGLDSNDFVVLFSARFTLRKRPLDLIESIARIDHKDIVLIFVGDGPERSRMENLVAHYSIRCIFTGFVGQKDLSRYYSIADMYAIVSSYDASPKSLNEALNFELPVLSTDKIGTATDLVKDNENGYLVSVKDIRAIGSHIDYLNKNREVARSLGKKSLSISDKWSIENDIVGIKAAATYVLTNGAQ